MDCPKHGCSGTGIAGDYVTTMERASASYSAHHHGHPALGLAKLAFFGAKMVLTTAYKCNRCDHIWRKWF